MQSILRRPLLAVLALLLAFWLAMANWRHPVLRFSDDYANLIAIWLLLLLPWATLVVAVRGLRRWWRWLGVLLALPALLVGTLDFAFVSIEVASREVGSPDTAFEPIRRLCLPRGGELVVYLSDCGAMCAFGTVVWQERTVAPGVRVVRQVYDRVSEVDPEVELLGEDAARIAGTHVCLRRWVWF